MYAYIVNSTGKQIVNGQTLIIVDRAWPDTGAECVREQKRKRKKDGLGNGDVGRWGKLEEGSVEPMIRGQGGLVSWRRDLFLRQLNYFIFIFLSYAVNAVSYYLY